MDKDFLAVVKLGTGRTITGVSLYREAMKLATKKLYPVVFSGGNSSSPDPSSLCLESTLDLRKGKGKIVICECGISPRVQNGDVVKKVGGVGMILANTASNGEELVSDCHLILAITVGENEAKLIKHYALMDPKAKATISFLGTGAEVELMAIEAGIGLLLHLQVVEDALIERTSVLQRV